MKKKDKNFLIKKAIKDLMKRSIFKNIKDNRENCLIEWKINIYKTI